jgi:hypothetical protein
LKVEQDEGGGSDRGEGSPGGVVGARSLLRRLGSRRRVNVGRPAAAAGKSIGRAKARAAVMSCVEPGETSEV